MQMCMCVCVCMYVLHTHAHAHTHTHTHTQVKHEVGRMLNKIDFSDEVHPRPQKLWKQ